MQLSPSQQAELETEADAMTRRLRGIVRRHKALVLEVCKAPLTPPSTDRPDRTTVRRCIWCQFCSSHSPSRLPAHLHQADRATAVQTSAQPEFAEIR